jgi:hypothetical protein
MTLEGLFNQIKNVDDPEISEELRIKLLNNFLNVTNENPGKLILNYQKSDNPILNFFDRDKKKGKTVSESLEENAKDLVDKTSEELKKNISTGSTE